MTLLTGDLLVVFCLVAEFEWSFNQDLSSILVKQEEPDLSQTMDSQPPEEQPLISPSLQNRGSHWEHMVSISQTTL